MESRGIISVLLVLAVVCPALISSQPKGENYPPLDQRGAAALAAAASGYIKDRFNPAPPSNRPEYYYSTQAPYPQDPQNYNPPAYQPPQSQYPAQPPQSQFSAQPPQSQYSAQPVRQDEYYNQAYQGQVSGNNGYQTGNQYQGQAQNSPVSRPQTQYQGQAQNSPGYQSYQGQAQQSYRPVTQAQSVYQAQPSYPQNYPTTRRPTQTQTYRPPVYVPTNQYSPNPYNPQQSTYQPNQPNYNNPQQNYNPSQQNYNTPTHTSSRFDEIGQDLTDPDFTTRQPVKNKPPTKAPRRPPNFPVGSRFSDRDDIKKLLKWDSAISNAMEKFALQLMVEVNEINLADTFMVSPYSIYQMLVLIAEGANGDTFAQLNTSLGLQSLPKTRDFQQYLSLSLNQTSADIILRQFAMIITDAARPVANDYESRIEKTYDATVERVWFARVEETLRYLNGQVSKLTGNQINDAISREDLYKAQLILLSGLYFQGSWAHIFNTSFTKVEAFHDTNGRKTGEVNMMFQRGPFAYSAVAELGCHILELPYAEVTTSNRYEEAPTGTGLSMILALPKKGLEISEALHKIYTHGMGKIYKELYDAANDYGDEEVEVHLPRFEISTNFNLKEPLEGFGITDVFDQTHANLSNINDQYFVSAMIHKTKISVDEKGTTAAAVTTSVFANKATPPKFHANKPFIFFIVDRVTKLILFSGQYVTPVLY